MRNFTKNNVLALVSCAALLFSACGDDSKNAGGSVEDQEIIAISDKTVTGVSQKGPFVNGSSVTVQELNGETLAQTGLGFEGKIKNDMGEFSVKVNKLESQYALLKANGFYRNEVSGEKSKSQVTLYALTDLSKRDEVNVNLLTHLSYERSLYLATEEEAASVTDAKKQAETEVLKSFEIEGDFDDAEDLNIFGESDQSAALLAISVLMQGNLSEGDFSERLANYAADIESDGVWNDTKTATQIADWAITQSMSGGLALIRNNIAGWKLSTGVPAFEKYVDNFWWRNYGLGTCDKEREGEVKKNQNAASVYADKYFICRSNLWYVATALEYDTYEWKDGKDGDVKNGDVVKENCYVFEDSNWRTGDKKDCSLKLRGCTKLRQDTVGLGEDKVWYICDARAWRNATDIEKDTFGWKDSTDGAIKKGNVTVSIYVFDKTKWRATSDVEAKLGGCVSAIADSVGKVGTTYYICSSNKWIEASAIEYDTYRWTAGKDGDSKVGSVNAKNCYVYENSVWRSGNANDCSLELRGCTKNRQDTVGQGEDKVWYICDAQAWRNATDIEKDTATWGAGKNDGEIRKGQINKDTYYIYDADKKIWRNATTLEKDTYDFTNNKDWSAGVDGEIKKGSVTDSIYVYDAAVWRSADGVEKLLGGCVAAIADSVGKVGSTYYICTSRKWVAATELQYDTYKQSCTEFGQIIHGNVNKSYAYFCYGEKWKRFLGNESVSYGKLEDERDGQIYRTVKIGGQTWMAENLNYADISAKPILQDQGWCKGNSEEHCSVYGRLYTWAATMDSAMTQCGNNKECSVAYPVQGLCPKGWSVPNVDDWETLLSMVENQGQLQSSCDWVNRFTKNISNGEDVYGFSAYPSGFMECKGTCGFDGEKSDVLFWTSSEAGMIDAVYVGFSDLTLKIKDGMNDNVKAGKYSVRCIKDEDE